MANGGVKLQGIEATNATADLSS